MSLCLVFLRYKLGVIMVPTIRAVKKKNKCVTAYNVFRRVPGTELVYRC